MKKRIVLLLALSLLLAGCACKHQWAEADCLNPKTCSECGETEGEALGHTWKEATCVDAKTCSVCAEAEGKALGHTWKEATCVDAKTCSVCAETEGEALGHSWEDATYDAPKTCSVCAETEGEALVRLDLGMTTQEMGVGLDAVLKMMGYQLEYLGLDEDGWPVYSVLDANNGAETQVYVCFEPTADGSKVYGVMIMTEAVIDQNAASILGVVAACTLLGVDEEYDAEALSAALQSDPQVIDGMACYVVEDQGIIAEMQVNQEVAVFWIYPAE